MSWTTGVQFLAATIFSPPCPDRHWRLPSLLSKGYQGLFPWGWSGRSVKLTAHLHLVPRSRMRGAIPPLLQHAFTAWCSVKAQRQPYLYLSLLHNKSLSSIIPCLFRAFVFICIKYPPEQISKFISTNTCPTYIGTIGPTSMLGGSLVTTAWRVVTLRMEGSPPGTEGSCEYIE
jgi:hypothetical protein